MSYQPKSEEQLQKEGLLPDGIYDFEVNETEEKTSKKGNLMFVLKLHVFDTEGNARIIRSFITFGNNFGERLFRHAAEACGLLAEYEAGTLKHSDFLNKVGKCEVNSQQDDKLTWWNNVKDYVKRGAAPGEPPVKEKLKVPKDLDDEIPF